MRIPTSKIYRAFEELDDLSDEQCKRLMTRVRQQKDYASQTGCIVALVFAGTLIVSLLLIGAMGEVVQQWTGNRAWAEDVTFVLLILFLCVPTSTATLLARDYCLRKNLFEAVHNFIGRIRCPQCKYLLLGQIAQDDSVNCPECGKFTTLESLGITAKDLIPPDPSNTPTIKG